MDRETEQPVPCGLVVAASRIGCSVFTRKIAGSNPAREEPFFGSRGASIQKRNSEVGGQWSSGATRGQVFSSSFSQFFFLFFFLFCTYHMF